MEHITNGGIGPDVLLVHGNSLSSGIWQAQLKDPQLRTLRLVAVDLPGHGKSPRLGPDQHYTMDAFAAEVAATAQQMRSPVLVGHSLGGHICMRVPAIARNVRGMVLMGSPPLASAADVGRAFLPTPAMASAFKADVTKAEARASATTYTWPDSPFIDLLSDMILSTDPRVRGDMGREIVGGELADEQALIRDCGIPVRMVHGADDPSLSLAYLEGLAGLFWQERVHVISGAGHSAQLQRPETFNASLLEFIDGL